ncbi:MAG: alpha/beta hydrolase [Leptolyngbya sp. SIOISBB]|nr:alpha/beta hydrolase [Leptolyngbya sp. SIOISBB]
MSHSLLRKLLIGDFGWTRLVRSLLLIYALFALYVYFRADSMIFLPPSASYQDTTDILKISVSDTEQISALYLPNGSAQYTLLYSHGNAEDLGDIRPVLDRLHSWGFSVFAYDYRGYGTSDGQPSERRAYQDIEAAYRYLIEQLQVPPEQVILYGRSLGGGAAIDLATQYSVAGLILESTFTSAFRVVVPIPVLPFDKFSNLKKLQTIDYPVLIMHGQADQTIPIAHSQALYEAASGPKLSLWVAEASHNDFTWIAGEHHQKALLSFQELIETQQHL